MSEADTSNPSPVEPDSSPDDRCLGEDANEQLPISAEVVNLFEQTSLSNSDNPIAVSETIDAEKLPVNHSVDLPQGDFAKNTDWFALACKLRQRNRELIKTVVQLEQALADSQEQLHSQIMRTRSADTLIARQAEELEKTQEQVSHLFHELEASHQAAQHQQTLIETISEQLEASQEQVAQLERECTLLQQDYNQQAQKLLETGKQVQELRSRLHRQQRYTLQFKAALEQCLEVPSPTTAISQQLDGKTSSTALIPAIKPIQPWSSSTDELDYPPETDTNRSSVSLDDDPLACESLAPYSEEAKVEPERNQQQQLATTEKDVSPELEAFNLFLETLDPEIENPSAAEFLEVPPSSESPPSNEEAIASTKSNWPSHVISPLHHAKRRKSRAVIDLPKFIPHRSC